MNTSTAVLQKLKNMQQTLHKILVAPEVTNIW
jgi:hypothetical protein